VERGEHGRHGGVTEGSPGKSIIGEALRWWRSSGVPATAPVDFGGRWWPLRLDKV
jgi:hypothetical protein